MTTAEEKELEALAKKYEAQTLTPAEDRRFTVLCDKWQQQEEEKEDERFRRYGMSLVYGPPDKDGTTWI